MKYVRKEKVIMHEIGILDETEETREPIIPVKVSLVRYSIMHDTHGWRDIYRMHRFHKEGQL